MISDRPKEVHGRRPGRYSPPSAATAAVATMAADIRLLYQTIPQNKLIKLVCRHIHCMEMRTE